MSQDSGKDDSAPQLGKITCGSCFKVLKVDLRLAGKKGVCPKCKAVFIVPAVAPAADLNPGTQASPAAKSTLEEDFDISLEKDVTFSGGTPATAPESSLVGDDVIEPTIIEPGIGSGTGVPGLSPIANSPYSLSSPSAGTPPVSSMSAPHPLAGSNPYAVPSYQTHPSPLKPVGSPNSAQASGYMNPGTKTTMQVMGGILMAITGLQFIGFVLLLLLAFIGFQAAMSDAAFGPARDAMRANQGTVSVAFMIITLGVVAILVQNLLIFNGGYFLLRVRSRGMALAGVIAALIPCNCIATFFSPMIFVIFGIGDVVRFIVAVIALVMVLSPGAAQEFEANDG